MQDAIGRQIADAAREALMADEARRRDPATAYGQYVQRLTMPKLADEMMCLRADNAGLRAENAELRQRVEGMEGAVKALRILLEP